MVSVDDDFKRAGGSKAAGRTRVGASGLQAAGTAGLEEEEEDALHGAPEAPEPHDASISWDTEEDSVKYVADSVKYVAGSEEYSSPRLVPSVQDLMAMSEEEEVVVEEEEMVVEEDDAACCLHADDGSYASDGSASLDWGDVHEGNVGPEGRRDSWSKFDYTRGERPPQAAEESDEGMLTQLELESLATDPAAGGGWRFTASPAKTPQQGAVGLEELLDF